MDSRPSKPIEEINQISGQVVGAAYRVHRFLGPGLLESTYEACLEAEIRGCGLSVERQKAMPVRYRDLFVEAGYRIDLLVEGAVIVEVKSVKEVAPIHRAIPCAVTAP